MYKRKYPLFYHATEYYFIMLLNIILSRYHLACFNKLEVKAKKRGDERRKPTIVVGKEISIKEARYKNTYS
jgi:hypothetical protein